MREDICSIPISEIFEPKARPPVLLACADMRRGPHGHLHYRRGHATEPDVRVETNRLRLLPPTF